MWINAAIEGFEEGKGFEHIENAKKDKIEADEIIRKIRDIWVHSRFDQINEIFDDVISSGIVEANEYLAFALYNWGNTLSDLAKTKEGDDAESLLSKAKEKMLQADEIKKGSGAYNLACISALLNDEAACREWLNLAYELKTLPELEHLNSDFDLDSVSDTNWFKEIIANVMNQV